MKIVLKKLSQITPYSQNPRLNDGAVAAVAGSIRQFGFRQPIVLDAEGVIVVGDTRYKAAQQLGLERVPVVVANDLTPDQIRAYRIADNKTGELAAWDFDLLSTQVSELNDGDFDMSLLGFADDELARLLGDEAPAADGKAIDTTAAASAENRNVRPPAATAEGPGPTEADFVCDPPEQPITQPGDLWVLGDHRLLCGDARRKADVDRVMDDMPAHLIHTDLPFAAAPVERDPGLRAWVDNVARVLVPGRAFYIWGGHSDAGAHSYMGVLDSAGLYVSQSIIWVKKRVVPGRKAFASAYESGFFGWRSGARPRLFVPEGTSDVWSFEEEIPHDTDWSRQRPIALATRVIEFSTQRGEYVVDLMGGWGSTVIAAERTERRACVIERDAALCDLIVRRWERLTGRRAQRQGESKGMPR